MNQKTAILLYFLQELKQRQKHKSIFIKELVVNVKNIDKIVFSLLAILLYAKYCSAEEITINNWMYHKSIKEVRMIYQEIKNGVKSGEYKIREYHGKKDCGEMSCKTYQFEITDQNGFIRAHGRTFRSRIHFYERIYEEYFDQKGILRFEFSHFRVFLGDEVQSDDIRRLYLDENGKEILHIQMVDGKVGDFTVGRYRYSPSKAPTNKRCSEYIWGQ